MKESFRSVFLCHGISAHISLPFLLLIVALSGVVSAAYAQASRQDSPASDWTRVPGADWGRTKPETVGYSSARLEALRTWLKTEQTTAIVVAVHGNVIFEYGDLSLISKVASVRKSVLSMLYGNYVVTGKIDTNKTVKDLALDDIQPFLPIEEHATLDQLLTARSGIYLPSGNRDLDDQTPKRGTEYPGTHFSYNNWDFNAAGTAFEKLSGKNIYDALESDLVRPIGMQDFDRARQKKISTKPDSVHPEYAMYLSTRDMARLGLLMERLGRWNEKQVIPADWCRYTTTLITPFRDINPTSLRVLGRLDRWGYGVFWWVWTLRSFPATYLMARSKGPIALWDRGGNSSPCCRKLT
ncbi:MAG TPA: serine hydrolase [Pyrinomonadaceae bacterium]|jgi:CubicO group peptidase (beta-lactamase class C family)|nr:serine hydrolase [Pyrinomonadaceae bacterium]